MSRIAPWSAKIMVVGPGGDFPAQMPDPRRLVSCGRPRWADQGLRDALSGATPSVGGQGSIFYEMKKVPRGRHSILSVGHWIGLNVDPARFRLGPASQVRTAKGLVGLINYTVVAGLALFMGVGLSRIIEDRSAA